MLGGLGSRQRPWRRAVVTVGLAGLAVAGCGGGSGSGSAAATTEPTHPAPTITGPFDPSGLDPTNASSHTGNSIPAMGLTPPGTHLRIGQAAVVPFDFAGTVLRGVLKVTVTGMRFGPESSLPNPNPMGPSNPDLPYYVDFSVTYVSGNDLSDTTIETAVVVADGRTFDSLPGGATQPGDRRCDGVSAPAGFTAPGDSYTTCGSSLIPRHAEVVGVEWDQVDPSFPPGFDYDKHPIVWS